MSLVRTIRQKLDIESDSPLDLSAWRNNSTIFEIAVYQGTSVADISDVESINLKIRPSRVSETILADQTDSVFDETLTNATWLDGTKQHASFTFTNSEMNLDLDSHYEAEFWIVFTAILDGGEERTLATGTITFKEDNNGAGDPPEENAGTAITLEQADARYLQSISDGSITNAKLATVATSTIKGRATAGTGAVEDLTPAQGRTVLGLGTAATTDATDYVAVTGDSMTGSLAVTGASATISTTGANGRIFTTGADGNIGTTGVDAYIRTDGLNAYITTVGDDAYIETQGENAYIQTLGTNAYISTSSTFQIASGGGGITTLSGTQTANRAIAFPDASGTVALLSDVELKEDIVERERLVNASTAPSGLTFSRTHFHRPIDLLPTALQRFYTRFDQIETTDTWYLESSDTVPTFEQGGIRFTGTGVAYASPQVQRWLAPNIITEITIKTTPASGIIGIGIGNAPLLNNRTLIYYDRADHAFKMAETLNGAATVVTTSGGNTIDMSAATNWKFTVAVYNNTASAWIDRGNGYELAACFDELVANDERYLTPANIASLRTFVLATSPGATSANDWVVSSYRTGYAGTAGIQNQYYVTYEDGTPILDENGKYYLFATGIMPYRATTGNLRWKHCRNIICKVDPSTFALEVVGFVALQRSGVFTLDDISGKVIYDRDAKKWRIYVQNSSQFDGGATAVVYQYTTTENILSGVTLVTESALVNVPSTGLPYWDMDVCKRGDNDWVYVYSERDTSSPSSELRAVISTGTTADEATTQVYKEATLEDQDGNRVAKIGGTLYALTFSTSGPVVKSLTTGSTVTTLTFDGTWDNRSTRVTHANVIGIPRGGVTYYILDGADDATGYGGGYATYGNRVVWRSESVTGNEFNIFRKPPRS